MQTCPHCRDSGVVPTTSATATIYCGACETGERLAIRAGLVRTWRYHAPK